MWRKLKTSWTTTTKPLFSKAKCKASRQLWAVVLLILENFWILSAQALLRKTLFSATFSQLLFNTQHAAMAQQSQAFPCDWHLSSPPHGSVTLSLSSCLGNSSVVPFYNPTVQQKALARNTVFQNNRWNGYSTAVHTGVTLYPPPLHHMKVNKKNWNPISKELFQATRH